MPDHDLALMRPGQDLFDLTTACIARPAARAAPKSADLGAGARRHDDGLAAALAAFYAGFASAMSRPGLRTGDLRQPWPEEMNRSVVDRIADLLFAPTASARDNLLRENVPPDRIAVTGNTVIDALFCVRDALAHDRGVAREAGGRIRVSRPGESAWSW